MIKLTEEEARSLVYDDNPQYILLEEIENNDTRYKDEVCTDVIVKKISDNSTWMFTYQKYISHYGSGESSFYDCELFPCKKVKKIVETEVWEIVNE